MKLQNGREDTALLEFLPTEDVKISENEPLSRHSSMKTGGPAAVAAFPKTTEALINLIRAAGEHGLRHVIVGNASNILFDDRGFNGLVIFTTGLRGVYWKEDNVRAECGVSLTALAGKAAERGLSGLEFAYGIPGTVGGAVYMNAGAYGSETAAVLKSSRYLDISDCTVKTLPLEEHLFGYRDSVFRHRRFIHLSSVFALQAGDKAQIRAYMNELMQRRRDKQPLEYPSAGSVFKRYPGRYTAQMIDEAGLRGLSVGGAQVSEKHAGFIVNKGNATSSDVIALVGKVREAIRDKYGIEIECEIIHAK